MTGVSIRPSSSTLAPGEAATSVTVSFAATVAGAVDVAIARFIDGGETPYLMRYFLANAVRPRLTFDRPKLVLPTTRPGHTAKASLHLINEGYDNLQAKFRPVDSQHMPLPLDFPDGSLVGLA